MFFLFMINPLLSNSVCNIDPQYNIYIYAKTHTNVRATLMSFNLSKNYHTFQFYTTFIQPPKNKCQKDFTHKNHQSNLIHSINPVPDSIKLQAHLDRGGNPYR